MIQQQALASKAANLQVVMATTRPAAGAAASSQANNLAAMEMIQQLAQALVAPVKIRLRAVSDPAVTTAMDPVVATLAVKAETIMARLAKAATVTARLAKAVTVTAHLADKAVIVTAHLANKAVIVTVHLAKAATAMVHRDKVVTTALARQDATLVVTTLVRLVRAVTATDPVVKARVPQTTSHENTSCARC